MPALSTTVEATVDHFFNGVRSALAFARGLVTRPKKVASVIPSSSMLLDELTDLVRRRRPSFVVELGPGTGGTTRALLRGLAPNARLLAIEIVPEFVQQLRLIGDPRLVVCEGDATRFEELLREHRLADPDLVVSGVPFSVMDPDKANSLVVSIQEALMPGGSFVAYQIRDKISQYADSMFGDPHVSFIPWNLPPLRLYRWSKAEDSVLEMAS